MLPAWLDRARHHFDFPNELHSLKPCLFLSLFVGPSLLFPENPLADTISEKPSMLVGSIRRILHDANVHRLTDRYSNRLSCFVIDEARRTFEERITRCLVHIELAERLQGVVAATLYLDGRSEEHTSELQSQSNLVC